jgi:small-conductance mechanosensitive channel
MDAPYAALTANAFVENVLRQLARTLTVLAGVLVAVEILDITTLVGAVVGTAGVAGIALGFAFKDIVENYLAGLLLSVRQPFAPNDTVEIQDVVGKVVRLTSRETILLDLDGNHVRIPNATVFRTVVRNFTRNPKRRFEVRLTVAPGEDLSRAMELGREVLHAMQGVLDEPEPTSRVDEVGDSWVVLVWNGWVDQSLADFAKVRSEAIRLLLARLAEEGVDMPPPEQRVRVVSEEAAPEREPESGQPGETAARQRDVSVDRTLDDQIEEDRRRSGEEDLLR